MNDNDKLRLTDGELEHIRQGLDHYEFFSNLVVRRLFWYIDMQERYLMCQGNAGGPHAPGYYSCEWCGVVRKIREALKDE